MRKIIAAINITIDGVCDHTKGIADEELHEHYRLLLQESGIVLYGRKTFELMKYWQTLLQEPSPERSKNDFAAAINKVPKLVFSNTLKETGWDTAELSAQTLEEKIGQLKEEDGAPILAGSRSMINQLLHLGIVDELQLCIHPMIAGDGLALFEKQDQPRMLHLLKTKVFKSGAIILYYQPVNPKQ